MEDRLIIVLSLTLGFVVWWLISRWYVMPVLAARPRAEALVPLVLPHGFRYIGLSFLVPGVVAADLPQVFALPAAYGDLVAATLALLAVAALRLRWPLAMPLVWVFNVEGTLDFLVVVFLGLQHIHPGQLGGVYLIPALFVPFFFVTHLRIFQLLVRKEQA